MSVQIRRRRETAAFLSSYVGAQGELLVDTTNNRVQVHDGTTPGGFPAAKLAEVLTNTRTAVADANYTVLASDRMVAFTSLGAARSVSLPAASTYPTGSKLLVVDESGSASAARTLTLNRAGADTINGGTAATVASAYGWIEVESNGVSRWTIVDQGTGSIAQQSAGAVAITGGTIDGTIIGQTARTLGAFSAINTGYSGTPPTDAYFYKSTTATVTLRMQNTSGLADYAFDGNSVYFTNYSTGDLVFSAAGGACVFYTNGVERFRATTTQMKLSVPAGLPPFTVATLPAGSNGFLAFASNGRKSGEAAGAGTGVTAVYSNGAWRRLSDESAILA